MRDVEKPIGRRAWGWLAVAIGLAAATAGTAVAGGGSHFKKPAFFPVGGSEFGQAAVADFNRDGRRDIAVATFDGNTVNVLDGKRHGFKHAKAYPAGVDPSDLAVGDLNRDGRPDIVAGNEDDNSDPVTLLLSKRGTGFDSVTGPSMQGIQPFEPKLADLNHDHKLDLITLNGRSAGVSVRLGKGNGTFGPELRSPTVDAVSDPVVHDFTGDGDQDLVYAYEDDTLGIVVQIEEGDGHGHFSQGTGQILGGQYHGNVVAGRFTRDRRLDLAVMTCAHFDVPDGELWVLKGGKHGLKPPKDFSKSKCTPRLEAGKLNGDDLGDLVTSSSEPLYDDDLYTYYAKKHGGFGTGEHISLGFPGVGLSPLADLNKDRRNDAIVVDDDRVAVLYAKKH